MVDRNGAARAVSGGMTLLELMVALVILALTVAVAAPALEGISPRWRLRGAAHQVENAVRLAQNAAATGARGVQVMYDVPEGVVWVRSAGAATELGRRKLPEGARVRFRTGVETSQEVAAAGVFADGTLDAHEVALENSAGYALISFDRLTGVVDFREGSGHAPRE